MAPAVCWSASALNPCPRSPVRVDARVDRHADEHEAHAEQHPGHARADHVRHLPQLPAQPPPLGLDRRPPHEHADRHEAHVLQRVDERVPHRRLEEDGEVPAEEDEHEDGHRHQGPLEDVEPAPQRRARERHQDVAGEIEAEHRVAHAHQQQRRGQVGDQQVLGHVGRQQVLRQRVDGREEPDDPQRDAGVPEGDLPARHRDPAGVQHPQRAQVQRLGGRHEDQGPTSSTRCSLSLRCE